MLKYLENISSLPSELLEQNVNIFFFNLVGLSLIITVLSKNKHAPFRTCLLRNKHLWRSGGYSYLYACVISVLD